MAVSISWVTGVIYVPQADLTYISPGLYEHDMEQFRLDLRALEDDVGGRPWPRTHDHNEDETIQGVTYADLLKILAPYTVTYEDLQYAVYLVNNNNNVLERNNKNQVSVNASNSAGLIISGSGVTEQDKLDIANRVWVYATRGLTTFGSLISDIWSFATRLLTGSGLTGSEQAELTGIKERTDNLPDAPADVSDVPTAEENAIELLDNQNAP